jgi:hypothetical protein
MLAKYSFIPAITIQQLNDNSDIKYVQANDQEFIEDKFGNYFPIETDGDTIMSFKKKTCGNPSYIMDTLIKSMNIRFQREGFDIQETLINHRIFLDGDNITVPERDNSDYEPSPCCKVE